MRTSKTLLTRQVHQQPSHTSNVENLSVYKEQKKPTPFVKFTSSQIFCGRINRTLQHTANKVPKSLPPACIIQSFAVVPPLEVCWSHVWTIPSFLAKTYDAKGFSLKEDNYAFRMDIRFPKTAECWNSLRSSWTQLRPRQSDPLIDPE